MANSESEHPWPRKGDRPFVSRQQRSNVQKNHKLEHSLWDPDWDYLYREGYFQQGMLTAQHLCDENGPIRPFPGLTFPMLFSFRHYLELSLKSLIASYSALADEDVPEDMSKEHALMALWNHAKKLLARHSGDTDTQTPKSVECCLNDFHMVDSSSQTFRYSKGSNGKESTDNLPEIDLNQLIKTMENLHSFFGGCEAWVDNALSHKAEMESEYCEDHWC